MLYGAKGSSALTCTGLAITYQVRPSVQGGAVKLPLWQSTGDTCEICCEVQPLAFTCAVRGDSR